MKLNEIYQSPSIRETPDIYPVEGLLYEINVDDIDTENQSRVILKNHIDPYIDGDRGFAYYSVWFDEKPVMLCRVAGWKSGDSDRFITDKPHYLTMLTYLLTLQRPEESEIEVHDPDVEIEALSEFYTFRNITLKDVGIIPNRRYWFRRFLYYWDGEHSWPYCGGLVGPSTFYDIKSDSMENRNEIRWLRIKEELTKLLEIDPEAQLLLNIYNRDSLPRVDRVKLMRETFEKL